MKALAKNFVKVLAEEEGRKEKNPYTAAPGVVAHFPLHHHKRANKTGFSELSSYTKNPRALSKMLLE